MGHFRNQMIFQPLTRDSAIRITEVQGHCNSSKELLYLLVN